MKIKDLKPLVLEEMKGRTDYWGKGALDLDDYDNQGEVDGMVELHNALHEAAVLDLSETAKGILKDLLIDLDGQDLSRKFVEQLHDTYIATAIATPITVEELENIHVTRGKKYWFKRNGVYYT